MHAAEVFYASAMLLQHTASFGDLNFWRFRRKPKASPDATRSPLFVTEHLESGVEVEDIQRLARVSLFGHTHESYSGFFTVNATHKSNLFFWFFKCERTPTQRPVVLWLQGGPGDSFVTTLFGGNGPYRLTPDGPRAADAAWTRDYNVLYIDSPVGTGFSFTSHYKYYSKTLDDVVANLYTALQQFFLIFPEFAGNEFYLAGESFAGKYIPALATVIHEKNKDSDRFVRINLRGLFIGCGFIDPVNQFYYADNLYEFGIVDEATRNRISYLETAVRENIKKGNYYLADAVLVSLAATILGIGYWPPIDILNPLIDATEHKRIMSFVTRQDVRREIHVGDKPFLGKRMVLWNFRKEFLMSASSHLVEALKHYPVLLYSGQFDMLIPPMQIDKVVEALQWPHLEEFQKRKCSAWHVKGELAGHRKAFGKLIVVEVLKANHFVLRSQPAWILELFTSFVNYRGKD